MNKLLYCVVVGCFMGCGPGDETPPALPALDGPIPQPPPAPQNLQLPTMVSQSQTFVDAAGLELPAATLGTTASVKYQAQLPEGWGTNASQAFSKERGNFLSCEVGCLREGKFVIGTQSIVEARRSRSGLLTAEFQLKLPSRKDTKWILRTRLVQGPGQPLLTLYETPVELLESESTGE